MGPLDVYLDPVVEVESGDAVYRVLETGLSFEVEREVVDAVQDGNADGVARHDRFADHDFAVGALVLRDCEGEYGVVVVQPVDVAACGEQQHAEREEENAQVFHTCSSCW